MARIRTDTSGAPSGPRIKPPIRTFVSVPTKPRVLMLANCEPSVPPKSYASTKPTPVTLFFPLMIAV